MAVEAVRVALQCPHCKAQHIDKNTEKFAYADTPHTRHLCLRNDGGCGRFFYTKAATIGVGVP